MLRLLSATAAESVAARADDGHPTLNAALTLEASRSCVSVVAPASSIDSPAETPCCSATDLRNRKGTTLVSIVCIELPAASCASARAAGARSETATEKDAGAGVAAHDSCSAASMFKESLVPTTYRASPSLPAIEVVVSQTPYGESCAQSAAGATTRSTPRGFAGCAAGQSCKPSEAGTARALSAVHVIRSVDSAVAVTRSSSAISNGGPISELQA